MAKVYQYILDFKAKTDKFSKDVGGVKGMLKGAAVAAGALFAVDKIMDAAGAVADYAAEISGVSASISKLTGLQGAALDQATGQAKALSSSYDSDINEAIKASNAMMKVFGNSSNETFDILNKGFATTANSNGDFLKQVQEYSTHFDEAGLSASEMTAIIAEGNKMGVFDDKSADAIKEGSIRLREMTKSTKAALGAIGLSSTQIQKDISSGNKSMFEVMQLVSGQLKTLPKQSPAVGAALADIFGGPGEDGIQFIRTLADVNTNLNSVVGQAGEAAAAQVAWSEELAEFHTIGAQVFGGTGRMMTQVKTTMMSWVNVGLKGLVDMANYFIDLYNESMLFRGAIQYIKMSFENVWEAIKLGFNQVLNVFKTAGKAIEAIFTGNFSAIPEILKGAFDESVSNAKEFGQNVAGNFMDAYENTLTPKKKIELISLSSDQAVAAGAKAGKDFANGVQSTITPETVKPIDFTAYLPPDEELDYDPFDMSDAGGRATMYSAVLGELDEKIRQSTQLNAAFGRSNNDVTDQIALTEGALQSLIEQGFNATDQPIQELMSNLDQLQDKYKSSGAGFMEWVGNFGQGLGTVQQGISNITSLGSAFDSLHQKQEEGNATALDYISTVLQMASSILGTIQVVDAISKAIKAKQIIETVATTASIGEEAAKATAVVAAEASKSAAVTASQAIQTTAIVTGQAAQTAAVVAASVASAAALMVLGSVAMGANAAMGISAAIASAATLPFPANLAAMGAALGVSTGMFVAAKGVATSLSVTPFADGGVVTGPTLGLVGEYPGARSNPELIAPADKMMGFIRKAVGEAGGSGIGGTVKIVFANGSLEGYMDHRSRKTKNFG